ncbi:TetR/AcrR family transcriptional regulator [Paenibacillus sp. N3/727]|uniref:TetR/AcrR family transcriptional regulator n=1 Tax=Paenibacillus sp. N3/727 TaxID=2925845 RepID=UPI001F52F398|nr:TetR/AcrR family transcriptional regulator [Paenibacillus sp. N3/727]UNK20140.1 TetR/AcrR family transcriptional regulator [Paenibacillus sp. N3/727]
MSTKKKLLEAASKIIITRGIGSLTLEAVANEAGVSKGGLLYHFPNKEELISGLNLYTIERFRDRIRGEMSKGKNYIEAYTEATLNDLFQTEFLGIDASVLAASANHAAVLEKWNEECTRFTEEVLKEGIPFELGLSLRLACDGLWYSKMFGMGQLKEEEQRRIIAYILQQIKEVQ